MLAKYIQNMNVDYRRIRQYITLGCVRYSAEYDLAVAALDNILDEIGEQETHPSQTWLKP